MNWIALQQKALGKVCVCVCVCVRESLCKCECSFFRCSGIIEVSSHMKSV